MACEIYTLTLRFPHDEDEVPWLRTIEVREDTRLIKLHETIQTIIEFDDDHLWEFFVSKNSSPRSRRFTVPKRSRLNEIYPLTGAKLYYLFDFGDNWLFEIRKSRKKKMDDPSLTYPRLIEASGDNPEQYPSEHEN